MLKNTDMTNHKVSPGPRRQSSSGGKINILNKQLIFCAQNLKLSSQIQGTSINDYGFLNSFLLGAATVITRPWG
jgi:hypothetical protein